MYRSWLVTVLAASPLAGCTDTLESDIEGTQSLAITLLAPNPVGSPELRLPDTSRTITFDIEAKDETGAVDTTFTSELHVYAQFLGTLTPEFGGDTLHDFTITNGSAAGVTFDIPQAFGPTVIWVDNGSGFGPDYVHGTLAGTSPTLWYRDPFIADLQTPADEMGLNALSSTPLQDKQIAVGGAPGSPQAANASRYGDRGRLVITSTFAQGYTVSDVQCADAQGNPPCTYAAYDHVMVFTFSAPRDQEGNPIVQGQVISGFGGGLSEFNGLTEIGFPQTFAPVDDNGNPVQDGKDRLPAPVVLDPATWFNGLSDPNGMINFERNEAAPIQINNGVVCPLDEDFDTFKQWKVDPTGTGDNCGGDNVLNVISSGIVEIDPAALVGKTLPKVVGVVRPVNIGSFNVWIIFPRSKSDVADPIN